MAKLNEKKIRWIIRELEKGSSMSRVANIQDISKARVSQLYREYRLTGKIPELKKVGRKAKPISREDQEIVHEMFERYHIGPIALETKIEREMGIHIPHNRIYRILLEAGKIMPNKRKQKQRKYVRFERTHSMSLWQGDWKHFKLNEKEYWLIAFLDDASRRIMCFGVFTNATTENTITVLEQGFDEYGYPNQILTDHGTQFVASRKDKKGYAQHTFGEFLEERKIQHILARVHHPQTNGKIERFFGTLEKKLHFFKSVDELIHWYNYDKPHMSLDFVNAETPDEAFWRKLSEERIMGYGGWLLA